MCVCVHVRRREGEKGGGGGEREYVRERVRKKIFFFFCISPCTRLFVLSLTYSPLPPSAPPPKRRRVTAMRDVVDDHVTGCARSEGYYKIDMRDKVKYLPHHRDIPKDGAQPKQAVSA